MSLMVSAGLLASACISSVSAASYALNPDDIYQGSSFFEKFNFYTATDPNWGFVDYKDQNAATASKLVYVKDEQAFIGVDSSNTYPTTSARGRPSIRLETKKTYQYGLFVLDLAHMPSNTCGTWPAFWTTNEQDWPRWGEIDILENVHEETTTLEALHTGPGCSVAGNQISSQMTGRQNTYNCDGSATSSKYGSQASGQGCQATNQNPNNYGHAFNSAGGGVYAMEWTKSAISIWHFGRNDIPNDLTSGAPTVANWGQPVFTTAQGSCNIDEHFKDQKIIIDNSFCGNWAGQDALWQKTSCYKSNPTLYATCKSYVAANPNAYTDSYWLVNSLKVYQSLNGASTSSANDSTDASAPNAAPLQTMPSTLGIDSASSRPATEVATSATDANATPVTTEVPTPTDDSSDDDDSGSDSSDPSSTEDCEPTPTVAPQYPKNTASSQIWGTQTPAPIYGVNATKPAYGSGPAEIATQTESIPKSTAKPSPSYITAGAEGLKTGGSSMLAFIGALALGMFLI